VKIPVCPMCQNY